MMRWSGRPWVLALAAIAIGLAGACKKQNAADAIATEAFKPLNVGDTVPRYTAVGLRGDTMRVGPSEPVTLVNVWATWCESCREEMQDLESMYRDYWPKGLRVIAVSVDEGDGARVKRFVEGEHLTMPVAHDGQGTIQQRYGTVGVPESYLIDTAGRLVWHRLGGLHDDPNAARQAIAKALGAGRSGG